MSRLVDVEVKLESNNDLQTYLDTFNKEIEEGNQSLQATDLISIRSGGEEEEDDENDGDGGEEDEDADTGTFFVDHEGNYYYQANKDSEPVPTDPPENIRIVGDSDDEDEQNSSSKGNLKDDGDYVYTIGELNDVEEGDEEDEEYTDDKEVFEFDELEDDSKVSNFHLSAKVVRLKQKPSNSNNSSQHHCPHCEYTTTKRYLLARHMKCHSDDRPFKCSVCERGFKTNASLQNHANTHTGNKPHRCKFCVSNFTTSGELVRHVRYKHTHEKPHKCFECDYASVELSKLKRHIRCHTGERPFQCPHCTYASPDTFKLKRHMRTHTGEKPYECDICHSRFTQSNSLKQHKLIHSVGDKPVFQCHLCPTTCGRKTDLRIHIQKLHTSEKPITCKRCGKSCPDRYSYKVHAKTHDGEKCFKCDLCPYASISKRHLDSHLLIHTDQKPFDCKDCEQSFRQKQLLRRHVNLYHNKDYVPPTPQAKIHSCPDCARAFSRKGNLMRHMAMHDPDAKKVFRLQQKGDNEVENEEQLSQDYEGDEYEDEEEEDEEMEFEEDEDGREDQSETQETAIETNDETAPDSVLIKEENELVAVQNIDGQQYMVVEVIQCDDDDDDVQLDEGKSPSIKNEIDDEFIISELTDDDINIIETSKTTMDDFGFSETEEILEHTEVSNKDTKNNIQMLEILE